MHFAVEKDTQKSDKEGELESEFWHVASQFDFENIGVTKPPFENADFRYLVCADCDFGPLGVFYPQDASSYFISKKRVKITTN